MGEHQSFPCITHCCPRCGCKYDANEETTTCPVWRGLHPGPDFPFCGEFARRLPGEVAGRCPELVGYADDEVCEDPEEGDEGERAREGFDPGVAVGHREGFADGYAAGRRAGVSFAQLREVNVHRCKTSYHPIEDWSLSDWMTAVAGEVGELAGVVKNIRRKDVDGASHHAIGPTEAQELAREAADVVIYLDLLCARAGVDLGEAVRDKFNIVSDRVGSDIKL